MTDPSTEEHTLLGLLADIRAAAGDRQGRLTQPELVEHIRGLKARADQAEQLRGFAQRVMEAWPEGGLDGLDLQDTAEEFGLLQKVEVAEPCGKGCSCVEYGADFPTDCYHRTSLLLPEPDARAWVNPLAAEVEALRNRCQQAHDAILSGEDDAEVLARLNFWAIRQIRLKEVEDDRLQ